MPAHIHRPAFMKGPHSHAAAFLSWVPGTVVTPLLCSRASALRWRVARRWAWWDAPALASHPSSWPSSGEGGELAGSAGWYSSWRDV
jgi:hypothetical protein